MKDYAKKSSHSIVRHQAPSSKKLRPAMLTMAIVFCIAAVLHGVMQNGRIRYFHPITTSHPKMSARLIASPAKNKVTRRRKPVIKKYRQKKTNSNQPKYDFYRLLPEMTVTVSAPAAPYNPLKSSHSSPLTPNKIF